MEKKLEERFDAFVHAKGLFAVNSVVFYQKDQLLLERYYNGYTNQDTHEMNAIWKGILSLLTGIALDKHLLKSVEVPVCTYLEAYDSFEEEWHHLLKVKHLLTMTSGIFFKEGIDYDCKLLRFMLEKEDWVSYIASKPMMNVPGLKYHYKEWDAILLSCLLQKAVKKPLFQFCKEVLFDPLGIESEPWPESPLGISYPVYIYKDQAKISAIDLAKIGKLLLHQGVYQGKRIVSRGYLKEACAPSLRNQWFGYLWHLYPYGYGLKGLGGQELVIYPEKEIVFVMQSTPTKIKSMYEYVLPFLIDLYQL